MTVHIAAREVGTRFGYAGVVRVGNEVIHETRTFPFGPGYDATARRAAARWAADNGYSVDPRLLADPSAVDAVTEDLDRQRRVVSASMPPTVAEILAAQRGSK